MLAQFLEKGMCLREVLSVGALTFKEIGNRIEPETVNTHVAPVVDDPKYFFLNEWIIIIQVRLMMEKPVPIVLLSVFIPHPVRHFKVLENNPHILVFGRVVGPYIILPQG